ncbi:MAG: hypothetical protein P1P64_01020 [Treponemataceae bacterium]
MIYTPKTELELYEIYEKANKIKIIRNDKTEVTGRVYGFTQSVDNDPEIAEIDIDLEDGTLSGAFLDEIESIEILE